MLSPMVLVFALPSGPSSPVSRRSLGQGGGLLGRKQHGGASHDTAFRNWFHGSSTRTNQYWICVNLNRFTRCYSIVGNVLGRSGFTWLYEVEPVGFSYDKHFLYSLGYPNMGNGWSNGKVAQPSKGKFWADWTEYLASKRGEGPGPNGFQELDLDVKATTLLRGNCTYKDNGVPKSESLDGATLPKSLYLKNKPSWFGDLNWPPFGPDTHFEKNKIPAQVRFEAMKNMAWASPPFMGKPNPFCLCPFLSSSPSLPVGALGGFSRQQATARKGPSRAPTAREGDSWHKVAVPHGRRGASISPPAAARGRPGAWAGPGGRWRRGSSSRSFG